MCRERVLSFQLPPQFFVVKEFRIGNDGVLVPLVPSLDGHPSLRNVNDTKTSASQRDAPGNGGEHTFAVGAAVRERIVHFFYDTPASLRRRAKIHKTVYPAHEQPLYSVISCRYTWLTAAIRLSDSAPPVPSAHSSLSQERQE